MAPTPFEIIKVSIGETVDTSNFLLDCITSENTRFEPIGLSNWADDSVITGEAAYLLRGHVAPLELADGTRTATTQLNQIELTVPERVRPEISSLFGRPITERQGEAIKPAENGYGGFRYRILDDGDWTLLRERSTTTTFPRNVSGISVDDPIWLAPMSQQMPLLTPGLSLGVAR